MNLDDIHPLLQLILLVGGWALIMLWVKSQIKQGYHLRQADEIFDRYAKRYHDLYGSGNDETQAILQAVKEKKEASISQE